MNTNDFPAFPHIETGDCGVRPGITARDYFAAKAMQSLSAGEVWPGPSDFPYIAKMSYAIADAMLEARKK